MNDKEKHKKNFSRMEAGDFNLRRDLLFRVSAFVAFSWLRIFHGLKVAGMENVPTNLRSYIIAANHTSNLDPFIIGGALLRSKKRVAYMAKQELFKHPLSAWYFNGVGTFSVNREKIEVSAIKTAITVLKQTNWALGIFPEGTRKKENTGTANVSSAKRGVAYFARAGNAPILPIAIAWVGPQNKQIRVKIGELIPPPPDDNLENVTAALEKALATLLSNARES